MNLVIDVTLSRFFHLHKQTSTQKDFTVLFIMPNLVNYYTKFDKILLQTHKNMGPQSQFSESKCLLEATLAHSFLKKFVISYFHKFSDSFDIKFCTKFGEEN